MDPTSEPRTELPDSYRSAAEELEQILSRLETSTVDVDALTSAVERAVALIDFCRQRLNSVEADLDRALGGLGEVQSDHSDR